MQSHKIKAFTNLTNTLLPRSTKKERKNITYVFWTHSEQNDFDIN